MQGYIRSAQSLHAVPPLNCGNNVKISRWKRCRFRRWRSGSSSCSPTCWHTRETKDAAWRIGLCRTTQNVVNAHLSSARNSYARDGIAGRIALCDRLAADAASIEASPRHSLAVPEASFAGHNVAGGVERNGSTHGIRGRGSADRAILLNDLHGARRTHWIRERANITIAVNRNVPDVIIDPALEVAKKRLGDDKSAATVRTRVKAATNGVNPYLVHGY